MIFSVLSFVGVSIFLTRYLDNHGIWFSLLLFMIFRSLSLQYYFKNILKIVMKFLYKIPGYILLLFGGFCLSWGGFIIRSFEDASVWQIYFLDLFF